MQGECLCASVEFELSGKLPNFYKCHCSLCRKQSGSSSNTATMVSVENFRWIDGESLITRWRADSGITSDFCCRCGSPVPNVLQSNDAFVWVPAGLLPDHDAKVVAHVCCDSKARWDESVLALNRCYSGLPEDLAAFVDVLNG